jgi:hypothetical protein
VLRPFDRWAGLAAFAVAVLQLGYAISFLIVRPDDADAGGTAASAFLLAAGVLAVAISGDGGGTLSSIDPRGLLTFAASGLSLLLVAGLLRSRLAGSLGGLLLVIYALRLGGVSGDSAALVLPAAVAGFVLSPAWYVTLGTMLRGDGAAMPAPERA